MPSSKRILIVEDEAISAMALQFTIQRMGHQVTGTVDTGEAAIAHSAEQGPDLVLMDTQLRSTMSGIEAANQIWQKFGIRSIFISAYNASDLQQDYRGSRPFLNLVKPVMDEDLEGILKELFHY